MAAGLGSMFLGAQAVHLYYRPLDDMKTVIDELKKVKQKQLEAEKGEIGDGHSQAVDDRDHAETKSLPETVADKAFVTS